MKLLPLQHLFTSFIKYIDARCRPNPKYTPDESKQEVAYKRNKIVVILFTVLSMTYALEMIMTGMILLNLFRIFITVGIIIIMLISSQYHPQIFKFTANIMTLVYGPLTIGTSSEATFATFLSVNATPLFILFATESVKHFAVSATFHVIYLHKLYQEPMLNEFYSGSPESLLRNLTQTWQLIVTIQTILTVLNYYLLKQAHQTALNFEKKRNEAENQKTLLLSFSHELRNLINSLTGNVKLACLEDLSVKAKELLLNAEVCGELLLHLINNILDTGKAQIGELEINNVPTKTYETFERIWAICSELIHRKGLKGSLKIRKDLPRTLMMDPHRITQIFLNFVGNSIKFTDNGSVNITIEWINNEETVNEECFQPYPFNTSDDHDEGLFEKEQSFSIFNDKYFCLNRMNQAINKNLLKTSNVTRRGVLKMIVTDTGSGMTQEETTRLFQKFSQVTSDTSKKKLGTGLGLFITKELCQKMHGEVRVYSHKDKGSAFIICIPADPIQEENENLTDLESTKSFLSKKRIRAMVVDDMSYNQVLLSNYFKNLGIEVADIAVNGIDSYQKYMNAVKNGKPPHIVAMDLDMPIMDGKAASRKIREFEAQQRLKGCFLLIISGNCVESEVKECLNSEGFIRANAFLRKPVTLNDVLRVIVSKFIPYARTS